MEAILRFSKRIGTKVLDRLLNADANPFEPPHYKPYPTLIIYAVKW
jgi:hypothetical protein